MFEDLIRHAIPDIYHLMCYIIAHDKKEPLYEDEESSIVDRPILKNATKEALEALGANLSFIDCCHKSFDQSYEVRCGMYNKAMENIFQKIPTIK